MVGMVGGKMGWGGAQASGHTVQMHPCPRHSRLRPLAAPGAPCLLPGPISCILPSQGQRPPSCLFTPGHAPLSEPLTDTLQTGKRDLCLTGLEGSMGFPVQRVSMTEAQEGVCQMYTWICSFPSLLSGSRVLNQVVQHNLPRGQLWQQCPSWGSSPFLRQKPQTQSG